MIINLSDFKKLVESNYWKRTQDYEETLRNEHKDTDSDDSVYTFTIVDGWATKTSTLGDIKITYLEGFNYTEGDSESLSTGTEGQDTIWSIENLIVNDDEGEKISNNILSDYLNSEFSTIDYTELKKFIDKS
jgi:hypothetical protein